MFKNFQNEHEIQYEIYNDLMEENNEYAIYYGSNFTK